MAMSERAGLELLVVIICFLLFWGYHGWLLFLRGRGIRVRTKYHDLVQAGKLARAVWTQACCAEEKEGILAVQTARNAITACTFLAATAGILATFVLNSILDQTKTDRIAQLAAQDPMFRSVDGEPLAAPVAVLGLSMGVLFASFVCLAQSVREYSHLGFYIRAVPSKFNPGALVVEDAMALALKAGFAFTLGLRLFYFFIPVVLYSIGVTALLVSTVCLVAGLWQMDKFRHREVGLISSHSYEGQILEQAIATMNSQLRPAGGATGTGVELTAAGGAPSRACSQQGDVSPRSQQANGSECPSVADGHAAAFTARLGRRPAPAQHLDRVSHTLADMV